MSIERPSKAEIQRFIQIQQLKSQTGNWYSATPHIIGVGFATLLFTYSIYCSMNPAGIVPRLLYEQTLSLPRRHLRHLAPALIGVGSLYLWDVANGVWDPKPTK